MFRASMPPRGLMLLECFVLVSFLFSIGKASYPGHPDLQPDYADALARVNFTAVETDLRGLLRTPQSFWPPDYGHYGPLFVRLAWHCAGTYRTSDGHGGCDGGRIRFEPERSWPDNANLDKAIQLLLSVKEAHGHGLSWGDLIVMAGTVAIEAMGGPALGYCVGRIDDLDGSMSYKLGPTFEQELYAPCETPGKCELPFGATTIGQMYVNPEGEYGDARYPHLTAVQIRDVFGRMNMNDTETVALIGGGTVALIGGGHSFGKAHGACCPPLSVDGGCSQCGTGMGIDTYSTGFEGPWTENPTKWDSQYFTLLHRSRWTPHKSASKKMQWSEKKTLIPYRVPHFAPRADEDGTGKPRQQVKMLTSDIALMHDPLGSYQGIIQLFERSMPYFNTHFAAAWYKLTTKDMGPFARCTGPRLPPPQHFQHKLPDPPNHSPDWSAIKKEILLLIRTEQKNLAQPDYYDGKAYYGALFVALAKRCFLTFRATDYLGGCNGAYIRLSPEADWHMNRGLQDGINLLKSLHQRHQVSYADLIVLAGTTALEEAGALPMPFCPGRTDATEGSASRLVAWTAQQLDGHSTDVYHFKESILLLGLSLQEGVALIGGGHALGKKHLQRSGFDGAWTDTPTKLNNQFFVNLFEEEWEEVAIQRWGHSTKIQMMSKSKPHLSVLPSDYFMRSDPQLVVYARRYARDNEQFLRDFRDAWLKMVNVDRFAGPTGNLCNESSPLLLELPLSALQAAPPFSLHATPSSRLMLWHQLSPFVYAAILLGYIFIYWPSLQHISLAANRDRKRQRLPSDFPVRPVRSPPGLAQAARGPHERTQLFSRPTKASAQAYDSISLISSPRQNNHKVGFPRLGSTYYIPPSPSAPVCFVVCHRKFKASFVRFASEERQGCDTEEKFQRFACAVILSPDALFPTTGSLFFLSFVQTPPRTCGAQTRKVWQKVDTSIIFFPSTDSWPIRHKPASREMSEGGGRRGSLSWVVEDEGEANSQAASPVSPNQDAQQQATAGSSSNHSNRAAATAAASSNGATPATPEGKNKPPVRRRSLPGGPDIDQLCAKFMAKDWETFIQGVEIKDRRYRLKTYRNCFVGTKAIDWMVENDKARTRDEARLILNEALHQGMISHVVGEHDFKDEELFYRVNSPLIVETAQAMSDPDTGVPISARVYHLTTYPACFVGEEAVSWMLKNELAQSRKQAVQLGQQLLRAAVISHVADSNKDFIDGNFFYRFNASALQKWDAPTSEQDAKAGKLAPPVSQPNMVTSMTDKMRDAAHYIDPFSYSGNTAQHVEILKSCIATLSATPAKAGNWVIQNRRGNYLHYHVLFRHFRKADDVELQFVPNADDQDPGGIVHIRAAARSGYTDFGVNRKRVELLRQLWNRKRVATLTRQRAYTPTTLSLLEGSTSSRSLFVHDQLLLIRHALSELHANEQKEQIDGEDMQRTREVDGLVYESVFTGAEMVQSLVRSGKVKSEEEAVKLGHSLLRHGAMSALTAGQEVFADNDSLWVLEEPNEQEISLAMADLSVGVARSIPKGSRAEEGTFLGKDAVDWLIQQRVVSSRSKAIHWLQRLMDGRFIMPAQRKKVATDEDKKAIDNSAAHSDLSTFQDAYFTYVFEPQRIVAWESPTTQTTAQHGHFSHPAESFNTLCSVSFEDYPALLQPLRVAEQSGTDGAALSPEAALQHIRSCLGEDWYLRLVPDMHPGLRWTSLHLRAQTGTYLQYHIREGSRFFVWGDVEFQAQPGGVVQVRFSTRRRGSPRATSVFVILASQLQSKLGALPEVEFESLIVEFQFSTLLNFVDLPSHNYHLTASLGTTRKPGSAAPVSFNDGREKMG
eukprot:g26999.t1